MPEHLSDSPPGLEDMLDHHRAPPPPSPSTESSDEDDGSSSSSSSSSSRSSSSRSRSGINLRISRVNTSSSPSRHEIVASSESTLPSPLAGRLLASAFPLPVEAATGASAPPPADPIPATASAEPSPPSPILPPVPPVPQVTTPVRPLNPSPSRKRGRPSQSTPASPTPATEPPPPSPAPAPAPAPPAPAPPAPASPLPPQAPGVIPPTYHRVGNRGRPNKKPVAPGAPGVSPISSPGRKGGRSRTHQVAPGAPAAVPPTSPPVRKRGRPRKHPVAPGAPAAVPQTSSPVRKRGRPRKHPVAPGAPAVQSPTSPPVRKPGRPRKHPEDPDAKASSSGQPPRPPTPSAAPKPSHTSPSTALQTPQQGGSPGSRDGVASDYSHGRARRASARPRTDGAGGSVAPSSTVISATATILPQLHLAADTRRTRPTNSAEPSAPSSTTRKRGPPAESPAQINAGTENGSIRSTRRKPTMGGKQTRAKPGGNRGFGDSGGDKPALSRGGGGRTGSDSSGGRTGGSDEGSDARREGDASLRRGRPIVQRDGTGKEGPAGKGSPPKAGRGKRRGKTLQQEIIFSDQEGGGSSLENDGRSGGGSGRSAVGGVPRPEGGEEGVTLVSSTSGRSRQWIGREDDVHSSQEPKTTSRSTAGCSSVAHQGSRKSDPREPRQKKSRQGRVAQSERTPPAGDEKASDGIRTSGYRGSAKASAVSEGEPSATKEEVLALIRELHHEHEGLLAVRKRLRREVVALQDEEDELRRSLGIPKAHAEPVPPPPPRLMLPLRQSAKSAHNPKASAKRPKPPAQAPAQKVASAQATPARGTPPTTAPVPSLPSRAREIGVAENSSETSAACPSPAPPMGDGALEPLPPPVPGSPVGSFDASAGDDTSDLAVMLMGDIADIGGRGGAFGKGLPRGGAQSGAEGRGASGGRGRGRGRGATRTKYANLDPNAIVKRRVSGRGGASRGRFGGRGARGSAMTARGRGGLGMGLVGPGGGALRAALGSVPGSAVRPVGGNVGGGAATMGPRVNGTVDRGRNAGS